MSGVPSESKPAAVSGVPSESKPAAKVAYPYLVVVMPLEGDASGTAPFIANELRGVGAEFAVVTGVPNLPTLTAEVERERIDEALAEHHADLAIWGENTSLQGQRVLRIRIATRQSAETGLHVVTPSFSPGIVLEGPGRRRDGPGRGASARL